VAIEVDRSDRAWAEEVRLPLAAEAAAAALAEGLPKPPEILWPCRRDEVDPARQLLCPVDDAREGAITM